MDNNTIEKTRSANILDAKQWKEYRYQVALSFAGDKKRRKIRKIAKLLQKRFGKNSVFFDEWHQSTIVGADADIVIQKIYSEQSFLVVACVCERYNNKSWTQDEWRAIRDFETKLRDAGTDNLKRLRYVPIRFDDGKVDGIFSNQLMYDVRKDTAQKIAGFIIERWELATGNERAKYEQGDPPRKILSKCLDRWQNFLAYLLFVSCATALGAVAFIYESAIWAIGISAFLYGAIYAIYDRTSVDRRLVFLYSLAFGIAAPLAMLITPYVIGFFEPTSFVRLAFAGFLIAFIAETIIQIFVRYLKINSSRFQEVIINMIGWSIAIPTAATNFDGIARGVVLGLIVSIFSGLKKVLYTYEKK